MSRPKYETLKDLAKEKIVKTEFERVNGGIRLHKAPASYRTDFFVEKGGKCVGVLEVKCRDIAYTDYPTIIVSLGKMMAGIRMHQLGLPFVIAFAMHDGIFFYRYTEEHTFSDYQIEYGGRTLATRDEDDIEPVCHIKVEWLEKLSDLDVHSEVMREV